MNITNKPHISVIIPIYNSEDSILRCLSSIQNQTLKDIEIICIDDCSIDNTNSILKELALKDKRIILLKNKKNVGPGISRNRGIDIARGDYLMFVDADDYIDIDLLEVLYNKAIDGSFDIVNATQRYRCMDGEIMCIRPYIERNLLNGEPLWCSFTYNHHGTLYKKELFDDKQIRYGSSYIGEDSLFLLKIGHKTNSIGFLYNEPYYNRNWTKGSLTDSFSKKTLNKLINNFHERMDYVKSEAYKDYTKKYFVRIVKYYLSIHRYISTYKNDKKLANDFFNSIKKEAVYFPNIESVKKDDFIIRAMIDYDVNLYTDSNYIYRNSKDKACFENGIKEWIGFAKNHPELKREWKLELINLLSKTNPEETGTIKPFKDKKVIEEYSVFLDNELENCTSLSRIEKSLVRIIPLLRKNKNIRRILSIIKRNLYKIIK